MEPPEVRMVRIDNYRGRKLPVNGAVIHSMSERIRIGDEEVPAPEFLDEQGLSVHAMITPDGTVFDCVPSEYIAFHAGVSEYEGQRWLNRTFLGCEFLIAGAHDWGSFKVAILEDEPYTEEQYQAGGWLYASWMLKFPGITLPRIVTHSSVSGDHVRGPGKGKLDPGPGFSRRRLDICIGDWVEELAA